MVRSILCFLLASTSALAAVDLTGSWSGAMVKDGNTSPLYITLTQNENRISGTLRLAGAAAAAPMEKPILKGGPTRIRVARQRRPYYEFPPRRVGNARDRRGDCRRSGLQNPDGKDIPDGGLSRRRRVGAGSCQQGTVQKWKFKPGYKDDQPVTVEATIEVDFRL